jgi:septin family protein
MGNNYRERILDNYHTAGDIKYYDLDFSQNMYTWGLNEALYISTYLNAGYDIIVSKSSLINRINSLEDTIGNKEKEIERLNNKNREDNSTKERRYQNLNSEFEKLEKKYRDEKRSKEIELKKKSDEIYLLNESIKNKELKIEELYEKCKQNENKIKEFELKNKLFELEKHSIDDILKKSINFELEINKFDEKIKTLIENISSEEKYDSHSFQKIENSIREKEKKEESIIKNFVSHLNIVLVGKSGVGKTTLINTIFNYDEKEILKTEFGKSCTMGEPKYYESEKIPLLRLADSRGIELDNYGIEKLSESINRFINDKIERGNPDEFVHCIWYCITGTRLENIEIDSLKKLSEIYRSKNIPIIMVYTQAFGERINLMKSFIKDNCNFKYDFVSVRAKKEIIDGIEFPPCGIDDLKEISILKAKEAVKTSLFESFIFQARQIIENILEEIKIQSNSFIEKKLNDKLKIMKEGKSNEEIIDDLHNLFCNLISNVIYFKEKRVLSNESINFISVFSKNFISDSFRKFDELFNNKISNINNEILLYIDQIYPRNSLDTESKKNNIIDEFVYQKKDNFLDRMWIFYVKKYINKLFILCVDLLNKKSENIFRNIPDKPEFKDFIEKIVEENFEEIKKKLK